MSKGLKQILVVVAVIAVFGIGIIILTNVMPDDTANPEQSAVPTEEPPTYYMIKEDGERLLSIDCNYSDGSSFRIIYQRDEDGKLNYITEPKEKYYQYNNSKFRSMMYTLTSLTAFSVVEENPDDISIYGLSEPQFTMTLTFDDKQIEIYIGDPTPVDYNFYAMTNQENTVYTLGNYLGKLLMRSELEYRDVKEFPTYTEADIFTNIDWVSLTKRDGTVIEVMLDAEMEHPSNFASSAYMLLSPVVSSCNDENIAASILEVVATLKYSGIVKDIPADGIALYGFDKPARLQMKDTSGNSVDITVGMFNSVNNTYYAALTDQYESCLRDGIDLTLLLYSAEAFGWLDLNYMTLLNRSLWLQNIHDVSAVEYDLNGMYYYLELFRYDDVTSSGVDVVRTEGILNGKNINETNTKRLYGRTLNLRTISEIPPDSDLSSPQYKITMHLNDGSKRVLEIVRLNERQYACILDGVAEFYIYYNSLQNLIYAFERLDDDREIPLIYHN